MSSSAAGSYASPMPELFLHLAAAIITTTLMVHLIVVSIQLGCVVTDGIRQRAIPEVPYLAVLWQNVGIGLTLIGFLQQETQLIIFGGLFIGLRLILLPLRAPSWNASLERSLLVLAGVSLALLASLQTLPVAG
jgi:hypothetical protein